jgi:hypothetical protein
MIASCRIGLALLVLFTVRPGRVSAEEIRWRDAASFEIEGRGWARTASPFVRLPDSARSKVSPTAWGLSADSSGLCVEWHSDFRNMLA